MDGWDITAVPAYGRDYKTADQAFAAWMDGKDFRMEPQGRYINKEDAEKYGVPNNTVKIRFNQKADVLLAKYNKVTGEWTMIADR